MILNTFFEYRKQTTWKSFSKLQTNHMLDMFSASKNLFKKALDCKVADNGVRSDHSAVQLEISMTSIKRNNEKNPLKSSIGTKLIRTQF